MHNPTTIYRTRSRIVDPSADVLIDQLIAAWNAGNPIPLEALLPANPIATLVADLACQEIELRLAAGLPARAADYLERYAQLFQYDGSQGNNSYVQYLVEAEIQGRKRHGPLPTVEDFAATFPQLGDDVERLLGTKVPYQPESPPGYELHEEIGRGGMGQIYRAHDLGLNREVAIKVLLSKYPSDSDLAIRFVNEAKITARLQHPGIPAVHQVGNLSDGRPFLAMKLIRGQTLAAMIKRKADYDTLGVFEGVCQAVAFAHEQGVIHRDLKPENVMVGAFGEVQVMDWGLAKSVGRFDASGKSGTVETLPGIVETQTGDTTAPNASTGVAGTPSYMPPEQAVGDADRIDRRTDVFALGGILCTMLTGRPPIGGESPLVALANARNGDTAAALDRLAKVSADPEVLSLCRRCLAVDPADRPADAGAVAKEVDRIRADAFERARRAEVERASTAVRAEELRKRRRVQVALVAAVGLLLTGVAGGWGWLEWKAGRDRERQVAEELNQTRSALALSELRVENLRGDIRLAIQSGADRRAIAAFDRAEADGLKVTPEMRLSKARALTHIGSPQLALAELKELEGLDLSASAQAQADMLGGALRMGTKDQEEGLKLFRRAVATGDALSPADREFAAGQLTTSPIEALRHFQEAVRLDPRHAEARAAACITLCVLGQLKEMYRMAEEALALTPDQPAFRLFAAISLSLQGQPAEAKKVFDPVRDLFPEAETAYFEKIIYGLAKLQTYFSAMLNGGPVDILTQLQVTNFVMESLLQLRTRMGETKADSDIMATFRIPPASRYGFNVFASEFSNFIKKDRAVAPLMMMFPKDLMGRVEPTFGFTDVSGVARARQRLAEVPEGSLYLLFAISHENLSWKAKAEEKPGWRDLMAETAAAYEQASQVPGLLSTDKLALDLAITFYANAAFDDGVSTPRPDLAKKGVELLRKRLAYKTPIIGMKWIIFVTLALDANELGLAHLLLDDWRNSSPKDDQLPKSQCRFDFKSGNYQRALDEAESLLKARGGEKDPKNLSLVLIRDRSRERLAQPSKR